MTIILLIKLLKQQNANPQHVKDLKLTETLGLVFSLFFCGVIDLFCFGFTFYHLIILKFVS